MKNINVFFALTLITVSLYASQPKDNAICVKVEGHTYYDNEDETVGYCKKSNRTYEDYFGHTKQVAPSGWYSCKSMENDGEKWFPKKNANPITKQKKIDALNQQQIIFDAHKQEQKKQALVQAATKQATLEAKKEHLRKQVNQDACKQKTAAARQSKHSSSPVKNRSSSF